MATAEENYRSMTDKGIIPEGRYQCLGCEQRLEGTIYCNKRGTAEIPLGVWNGTKPCELRMKR